MAIIKQLCIISDIDGVYTDSREWHKYVPASYDNRKEWDEFANYVVLCKPNKEIIDFLTLMNKEIPIIFITGRENVPFLRRETLKQIQKFSDGRIKMDSSTKNMLLMRNASDYRRSSIVKRELLRNKVLPLYTPIVAIDDEEDNVKMFQEEGITSFLYTKLRK